MGASRCNRCSNKTLRRHCNVVGQCANVGATGMIAVLTKHRRQCRSPCWISDSRLKRSRICTSSNRLHVNRNVVSSCASMGTCGMIAARAEQCRLRRLYMSRTVASSCANMGTCGMITAQAGQCRLRQRSSCWIDDHWLQRSSTRTSSSRLHVNRNVVSSCASMGTCGMIAARAEQCRWR